jgi:hypothetical protein
MLRSTPSATANKPSQKSVSRSHHIRGSVETSEPQREAGLRTVVDQLEEVVVLVTLLMLKEVGEVIAGLKLGMLTDEVNECQSGIGVALLQVDGPALLAQAVHPRQTATCHR